MTDLLSRFTDYKNDKRKDSQIVQTIKNKNFTNKELRAGYRFGSRSILLHFFLFLFFSERFVNSINITQEMKIIPLPSDFANYLFLTPTALCHCCWCPMSLPLVCHSDCQFTLRNVQVFFDVLG